MTARSWRWHPAPLARRLAAVAVTGLVLAVLARRAELLPLAIPALVAFAVAGREEPPAAVDVTVGVEPRRCFEGEQVRILVTAATRAPLDELAARIELNPGLIAGAGDLAGASYAGAELHLDAVLTPGRWGRWSLGTVEVTGRSAHRLRAASVTVRIDGDLVVFPRPEPVGATVAPRTLPYGVGDHASRQPESGIEFAGIRRYAAGDAARRINWPVTTRRGALHVTTYAAERPVDVVVVVDAFSDVGPAGSSSLDFAIRGATGLAQAYLRQRDRVGLVVVGGTLRWLTPGIGERQFYRVVEEVLRVRRDRSFLSPDVTYVPRAVLPPSALVVVFSPLLDDRALEVIRDLRERGTGLAVVDVLKADPPDVGPGRMSAFALRLWRLEREAMRVTFRDLGVPVLTWDGAPPLDLTFAGVPR